MTGVQTCALPIFRMRKVHLQHTIQMALQQLRDKNMPLRIVDIAAGHGRYVLDALTDQHDVEQILLRDYSELNVEKGQAMIAERNLTAVARFETGDAFDRDLLARLAPNPTLAIVSGLIQNSFFRSIANSLSI